MDKEARKLARPVGHRISVLVLEQVILYPLIGYFFIFPVDTQAFMRNAIF